MGRVFSAIAILLIGLTMIVRPEDVPPAWNPFTPLDLDAPPNMVSRWKVRAIGVDGPSCRAALAATRAKAEAVPDRADSDDCHIRTNTRVRALSRATMAPLDTRCEMAARLYIWERHELQPAARRLLGADVARIQHYSSFACRRMRTSSGGSGWLSQHATANAVDIAGFVLSDGRRISVKAGWPSDGPEAAFLRAARDGLCNWFNVTLGPEYNALHADHFHADMGRYLTCR